MRDGGAFDYLTKPFDFPLLLGAVERAVKLRTLSRKSGRAQRAAFAGWIGRLQRRHAGHLEIDRPRGGLEPRRSSSPARPATGKELVARALRPRIFGARPATIRGGESGGAAAGADRERAVRPREGRLHRRYRTARRTHRSRPAVARYFSTRSATSTARCRPRLLRVLQDGAYERVGGNEPLSNGARVVTATNKPGQSPASRAPRCPRRSLLSIGRHRDRGAAAAGAPLGHSAVGGARARRHAGARAVGRGDGDAARAPALGRQCPRADPRRAARGGANAAARSSTSPTCLTPSAPSVRRAPRRKRPR